jgi:hypothetical protein
VRTVDRGSRDRYSAIIVSAWLAGYLSSYSVYIGHGEIHLPDRAARDKWMSNYCLKNPLDTVSDAANRLIDELNRRAQRDLRL